MDVKYLDESFKYGMLLILPAIVSGIIGGISVGIFSS